MLVWCVLCRSFRLSDLLIPLFIYYWGYFVQGVSVNALLHVTYKLLLQVD